MDESTMSDLFEDQPFQFLPSSTSNLRGGDLLFQQRQLQYDYPYTYEIDHHQETNETMDPTYTSSDDLRLTFMIPLLVIVMCICISTKCPPPSHPIEPIDFEELDAMGDNNRSRRRARIKRALEDNKVMMVVKEENIKPSNSKNDRLMCTTPDISLHSEADEADKVHTSKDSVQSNEEREGDVNVDNQHENSVPQSDVETGDGDNTNNPIELDVLAEPDIETGNDDDNQNNPKEHDFLARDDVVNTVDDNVGSENLQDAAQPDIEKGSNGDETGTIEDDNITEGLASSYAKKLSKISDVSNDDLLILPRRVSPQPDSVPNTCAICFESYKPGDTVAWSNNRQCIHAFHLDCVLEYLVLVKGRRVPCPTCRQTFTTFSIKKSNSKPKTTHAVHHHR